MIRKTILLLILGFGFIQGYSQAINESAVPVKCKDKVKNVFPTLLTGEGQVKWEKKNVNYKATLVGRKDYVLMDSTSKILLVEQQINPVDIPKKVIESLKLQYPDMEITELFSVMDNKSVITYRATITTKPVFNDKYELISPKPLK
jgi:hypothetical protein